MIQCLFLISRQGKTRLTKWYTSSLTTREKTRFIKEINAIVLTRTTRHCNFLEYNEYKIVYKRYASLYFICIVDKEDNELSVLEIIHHYVEVLDKYFGNVCELDLIFNFHKAYHILDELLLGGFVQEPSKKIILKAITSQEALIEETNDDQNR
ncbi:AP-1 complex subunit sigma-2 [Paramecium bursaria]